MDLLAKIKKHLLAFFILLFVITSSNKMYSQCNTNTSICTPGTAGPFNFVNPGPWVSSCLDFNGPDYGYIILYITQSGNLNMLIQGDVGLGYLDVAVFNIPSGQTPCTAINAANYAANEIGCNYADLPNGCNQFGNAFACGSSVAAPVVTAGQVLMILVENYDGFASNFTLQLATTPGSAQTGPPNPAINPAGPFCSTSAATQLTAINNGGTWSGPGTSAGGMFNPATAGVGTHTINYSIGTAPCNSASTTTVQVVANPSVTVPSATICPGGTATLTATPNAAGGTYVWNPGGLTGQTINVSPGASTNYTVTYSFGGCSSPPVTASVTVNSALNITVNSPTICNSASATLTASGATTYSWAAAAGLSATTGTSVTANPTTTTIYTVTGTTAGCTGTATSTVTVISGGVTPVLGNNGPICENTTLNLTCDIAGGTYVWTGPNGFASALQNPSIAGVTLAATGTYSVTVTMPSGCSGTATTPAIINPIPTIPAVTSQTVCAGVTTTAINYNPTPATATVNWTNSDGSIGIGASGTGNIASFTSTNGGSTTLTGNFIATPTDNGCTGTPQNFSIIVDPIPSIPSVTNQTVCTGDNTATVTYNPTPATATINWTNSDATIGVGASGAGDVASFAGVNTGATVVTGNFVATPTLNGCVGTPQNFSISISPLPTINAIASQTVCANASTTAITFNANPGTATVNWTNSDGTIGVAATGTGDIASFTGLNSGSAPITGNFSATPTMGSCIGSAEVFSITIDPIPSIPAVTSQTICAGATTTTITFNPTPGTATVNWTNSDATIGIGASGSGDINSFTGINAGSTPLTGNFVATPTENGCNGISQNFSIVVNPIPSIPAVTSQTICATASSTAINFNPTPATATVNWTNSDGTIGIGTSGSGNIAAFTGTNAGTTMLTGNFVATPTENGCTGTSQNFSININPTPSIPAVTSQTVCAGVNTTAITYNPTPATATVNWTNSDGTIGVGVSGSGDISAFAGLNAGSVAAIGNFVATPTENGCTGTSQTFSITVNPIPSISAVANQTVCANVSTNAITFISSPVGATINWTNSNGAIGQGTSGSGNIAAFVGINGGTTTVTGDFAATPTLSGCAGAAQNFTITVNPLPTVTASSDAPKCVNQTVTFSATGGVSYSWTGPNSYASSSQNPVLPTVTTSMSGVYSVTVTDFNSCVNSATTNVLINSLPITTISSNSPVCIGGTINLTAGGGTSYSWTNPALSSSFPGSSSFNPSISPATAVDGGNYSVVVTDGNGCSAPNFITVSIVPLPTPFAGSNTPVCEEDNLLLSLSQPYASYIWTGPNSFTSNSQNPSISGVTVASTGTYSVTVTDNNGCIGSTTTPAIVNPLPNGVFAPVTAKCAPLCDTLVFIPQPGSNIVAYSWDLGPGLPSVNNDSIAHCYNGFGVYDVSITIMDSRSCNNTITQNGLVTVFENPVADFTYSPNPITVFEPTATFYDYSSGPPAQSHSWQFGDPSLGSSNLYSPTFTFPDVGVYDVSLFITTAQGCTSTVVKPVPVLEEFVVYIPNSFSPNNDGDNETFGPVGIGIDKLKYRLSIYNRWGEKLFETTELGENWNGKKMGSDKILMEDIYIYKFECRKTNGEKFTKSGHVTLVK